MAKKPLRSQLNQIRAWVREGRTDAWIAHQLELPAAELREFKRRHGLTADGGDDTAEDLRDEIEAEVEAATREAEQAEDDRADSTEADEADADGEAAERRKAGEDAEARPAPAPQAPRRTRRARQRRCEDDRGDVRPRRRSEASASGSIRPSRTRPFTRRTGPGIARSRSRSSPTGS